MKKTKLPKIVTAYELEKEEIELKKAKWKSKMKNKKLQLSFQEKNLLRDGVIKQKISLKDFSKYYIRKETGLMALHRLLDLKLLIPSKKVNVYYVDKKVEDSIVIWGN